MSEDEDQNKTDEEMNEQASDSDAAELPADDSSDKKPEISAGDDEDVKEEAPPSEEKVFSSDSITLGDSYEILADTPLEKYDKGPIKAFVAKAAGNSREPLFAVVCEDRLVSRRHTASTYQGFINPSIPPLMKYGVVDWKPENKQKFVYVFKDIMGEPLMQPQDNPARGMKPEKVIEAVIHPITSVLQDFRDKDFIHGNINPTNLFDGGNKELHRTVLGECLSTPSGVLQPTIYEPIERAMCDPLGKGKGTQADDLYSFGVSVAVLIRSTNPVEGLEKHDIIRKRMEIGSFGAILGSDRFSGPVLEFLRGVLNDDPSERWDLDHLLAWIEGRRLSSKSANSGKKAQRPIIFNGEKYLRPQFLAMDLEQSITEAVQIIQDGTMKTWLSRSVEDNMVFKRTEEALATAKEMGSSGPYKDRLASFVSCALDPKAPIRYKTKSYTADGFGSALAYAIAQKEDVNPMVEMITQGIILHWARNTESPIDVSSLINKFDTCRNFMRQDKIGFGIERCLYKLNPEAPCYSDKLKGYYISNPEDMVFAYEDMCLKKKAPATFIDRHVAAFLLEKDSKAIETYLTEISSEKQQEKILGNIKTLATLQRRSNLGPLPGIAEAFLGLLPAVYKTYHDKKVRADIEKNMKRFAIAGDLVKMAGLLDNKDYSKTDFSNFKKCVAEFMKLEQQRSTLAERLEDKDKFGKEIGQDVAAFFACIVSAIITVSIFYAFYSGGGGGY